MPTTLSTPLRQYLLVLFLGITGTGLIGPLLTKAASHRALELALLVLALVWCFRPSQEKRLNQQGAGFWYSAGLLGFTGAALISGANGSIPWISLSFTGLALMQFALLPWVAGWWRDEQTARDGLRLLGLLAFCVLGMDVGIGLVVKAFGHAPYAWVRQVDSGQDIFDIPYLFMNPRWSNQFSVLLIWSGAPILRQLKLQQIAAKERLFWLVIAWGIPIAAWLQILLNESDGALIAILATLVLLAVLAQGSGGEVRHFLKTMIRIILVAGLIALIASWIEGQGASLLHSLDRNAIELNPQAGSKMLQEEGRLPTWILYLKTSWQQGLMGIGITAIAAGSFNCAPHNLAVSLIYWTGVIGLGCAALLSTQFWPSLKNFQQGDNKALLSLPMLTGLAVYQFVDDVWIRPVTLAVLLPILALAWRDPSSAQERGLRFRELRLLGLTGALLICLALANPDGPGLGPSPQVQAPGRICLLFF